MQGVRYKTVHRTINHIEIGNGDGVILSGKIGYRDVKKHILDGIREGTWAAGAMMTGEVELARDLGCARATVNRAMRELAEEGFVDRKRKTGTRVNAAPVRQARFAIPLVRLEVESTGATYRYALVNRKIMTAPDWLRARIGLQPEGRVLHVQCMHYANNTPFQFEDRWINIGAVPNIENADFDTIGPNEWLVNEVPFTDAEISFTAMVANEVIAGFLSLSVGEPVFTAERTTWLQDQPVTFARMSFGRGYRLTTRF